MMKLGLFKKPLPGLGGVDKTSLAKSFAAKASSDGMSIDLTFGFAGGRTVQASIAIQDLQRFSGEMVRATEDVEKIVARRVADAEALAAVGKGKCQLCR